MFIKLIKKLVIIPLTFLNVKSIINVNESENSVPHILLLQNVVRDFLQH